MPSLPPFCTDKSVSIQRRKTGLYAPPAVQTRPMQALCTLLTLSVGGVMVVLPRSTKTCVRREPRTTPTLTHLDLKLAARSAHA